MSTQFDVFMSYSRQDADFARELVSRLCQSGLNVWFDEEQIRPGDVVQASVLQGLEKAQHAILLVTESWLESHWTQWERDAFLAARRPGHRVVPILRLPRDVKQLGPELASLHCVHWLEGDPDWAARFWEVYCGLGLASLGPRESWSESGRQVLSSDSAALPSRRPTTQETETRMVHQIRASISKLALECNRAPQWGELVAFANHGLDGAYLVRGGYRQAHSLFLERIRQCLPKDPRRRIRTVTWGPVPPMAKGTAIDALAKALECSPAKLVETLRAQLTHQNLILLHAPVQEFYRDECDVLRAYYLEWLPELIREVNADQRRLHHRGGLKVVQSISWRNDSRLRSVCARALRFLGTGRPTWVHRALEREDAETFLEEIEAQSKPPFPVLLSSPLKNISRKDVENWSRNLPQHLKSDRLIDIVFRGLGDSADILQRIMDRLEDSISTENSG